MKTLDIEIAIMKYYGVRQYNIVPNVSWGIRDNNYKPLHECDLLILSSSGYATEIEIKISKYDLLKDKDKKHNHNHNHIKYLYFAVPEELEEIALANIPERAGLYIAGGDGTIKKIIKKKKAEMNTRSHKWTLEERLQILRLGTMRIFGLKMQIKNLQRIIKRGKK